MPRPRKARATLTKKSIDGTTAGPKDQFLWDGIEHGLGVKITPAGSKVFILQKSIHGRLKRITLGAYGDLTLEDARKKARIVNGQIAEGHDPVAEVKAERDNAERQARLEQTVSELWDRYAIEVMAVDNKPSTAAEKRRMWDNRIKPAIGKLKIKDVTDSDVGAIVRAPLRIDKQGSVIAGKGEAGNLYRFLHHLFRKALAWNLRPRELGNPLETVGEPKVKRRERLLTDGEVGALLKTLDSATGEQPHVVAAIKAAILTGARISELLGLRWEFVRRDERELHLPDTKSGFSRRPLSEAALKVLEGVGRMPGSPFVFRAPSVPTCLRHNDVCRLVSVAQGAVSNDGSKNGVCS